MILYPFLEKWGILIFVILQDYIGDISYFASIITVSGKVIGKKINSIINTKGAIP